MVQKGIVIDTSKCIGCRACQIACQQWHSLTAEDTTFTGTYTNPPELSGTNLTLIKFFETESAGQVKFHFVTNRCRHCDDPQCKKACPLKAIKRQKNGIVRIDPDICDPFSCVPPDRYSDPRPCQIACPFKIGGVPFNPIGIPRKDYVKNGGLVSTKMMKCDFCYNRFGAQGNALGLPIGDFANTRKPACEVTCAPGAIKSYSINSPDEGKICTKIKNKAKQRVTFLKANGYPNANVYPNKYLTHVVWVLLEPPSTYGFIDA
jgi:formate dehydrogenase iron-sulfur subunit